MMNNQTSMTPLLVTVEVAAEMLSVSPEDVQGMVDDGTLVSIKVAGQVRLGVEALHAFVATEMVRQYAGAESIDEAYESIDEVYESIDEAYRTVAALAQERLEDSGPTDLEDPDALADPRESDDSTDETSEPPEIVSAAVEERSGPYEHSNVLGYL